MIGGDKMKWNEIPKFTEYDLTNYINYGFVGYVDFINEQVGKYNLQLNPEFQRGHVWTEEQQIAYIEFILRGGKTGRDFYFNWNKRTDEYVCVDGLQRTTAFIRFVNKEIKVFNQYFDEFEFGRGSRNGAVTEHKVNVYMNYLNDQRKVLQWYVDMNAGGIPHTYDEIERVRKMIQDLG